jgi:hypothetical protein
MKRMIKNHWELVQNSLGHCFWMRSGWNYRIRQVGVMKPTRLLGGYCQYPMSLGSLVTSSIELILNLCYRLPPLIDHSTRRPEGDTELEGVCCLQVRLGLKLMDHRRERRKSRRQMQTMKISWMPCRCRKVMYSYGMTWDAKRRWGLGFTFGKHDVMKWREVVRACKQS